ncbi:phosphohistidine phosphatase SixA [Aliikangiella maris]|uniref:Phosphohistidine phosphatase SixA n=2 Tax=Aliikangiella maris TaxID=3162458 RepID=A0ABV2BVU1_9GAMM
MLKTLWIMRHGLAVNEFQTDFSRALSETGKQQAQSVARQMLAQETILPSHMLVSPFRRTQQTAEIVHSLLNLAKPFATEELLVHYADSQLLGEFLLESPTSELIIVSHMPIVARLCQYLSPGCQIFGFETAQIVKLTIQHPRNAMVEKVYLPE